MSINNGMSWVRRQGSPITIAIIASMIVVALGLWFSSFKGIEYLALTPQWKSYPWTFLTYPWAYMPFTDGLSIICFVFLCMWIFFTGGSIERELGQAKYALLWLVMILLPALFVMFLGPLTGRQYGTGGMWLPEAAITIVWCVRNPTQTIMLYGIIPLSGKWLGWVTAATTLLLSGVGNPVFGVICSLHLIVAWAYAANRIPFWVYSRGGSILGGKRKLTDSPYLKKHERMGKAYFDDVKKREKERDERDRLRKLFESSIQDEDGGKEESR